MKALLLLLLLISCLYITTTYGAYAIPTTRLVRVAEANEEITFHFEPSFGALDGAISDGLIVLSAVKLNSDFVLIHSVVKSHLADLQFNYVIHQRTGKVQSPRTKVLASVLGSEFRADLLLAVLEEQFKVLPFPRPGSSTHVFSKLDAAVVTGSLKMGFKTWDDDDPLPQNMQTGHFVWEEPELQGKLVQSVHLTTPALRQSERFLAIRFLLTMASNALLVGMIMWLLGKSRFAALIALLGSGRNFLGSAALTFNIMLGAVPAAGDPEFLQQQFVGQMSLILVYFFFNCFIHKLSLRAKFYLCGRLNNFYVIFWSLKWYAAYQLIFHGSHPFGGLGETLYQLISLSAALSTVLLDFCILLDHHAIAIAIEKLVRLHSFC